MADALRRVKAVLRHDALYFSVKLRARQNLVVGVDFVDGITERDFLRIGCLVIVVIGEW